MLVPLYYMDIKYTMNNNLPLMKTEPCTIVMKDISKHICKCFPCFESLEIHCIDHNTTSTTSLSLRLN